MRVVVAPDKFKGSLTAAEAAEAIGRGLRAAGADPDLAPVADGGEGTLDALHLAVGGSVMGVIARGPLGIPVRAHLARLNDGTGVVELSQASGLRLVPEAERDPMRANTTGTGELIKGALARRPSKLIVAIGGSATVDGGTGLARALGIRFLDADGAEVPPGGDGLSRIATIDASGLDACWSSVEVIVAADVMSPLAGPEGAARVYGPQKGATLEQIRLLERGLETLGKRIEADLGVAVLEAPGAGAAGGVGAMLLGMGAVLRSGAEVVFEAIGLAERIARADLVVTGEGRLDESTMACKAPAAVARLAAEARVPCVALVGEAVVRPDVFAEVRSLAEHFGSMEEAKARAGPGLQALAARVASDRR
ncbi:MAG: glycerate kinase family protein [Actinomycetota bacterium]